jgi:peptidoglycan glycosyltransferase
MEGRIRWLGVVFLLCFGLLFLQLNNWQLLQAKALQINPLQPQPAQADIYTQQRGMILSCAAPTYPNNCDPSDLVVMAESLQKGGHWQRYYPHPYLFAPLTGYWDVPIEADGYGLERSYTNYLQLHESPVKTVKDLLTQHQETDDVVTTISYKLQLVAQQALAGRVGAVVALDPQNGAVLALYGNPTFNPNALSTYDNTTNNAYYLSLGPDSDTSPLVNQATANTHPPGSTFKIIDTAAIFDHQPALAHKVWPFVGSITVPGTANDYLQNYGAESCGGPLAEILARSCDTAYAEIGVELGWPALAEEADSFGFNATPPLDIDDVNASSVPAADALSYPGDVAISAVGQLNDQASALQMALVAAGVANDGVIMTPHLLDHVLNQQGQVVASYQPHPWRTATSKATAAQLQTLMLGPTQDSYGTLAGVLNAGSLGGVVVAGKTGTAQTVTTATLGDCGGYDWVTSFGPAAPGQTPAIAVAAWVSGVGSGAYCGGTGALVAGPIVQAVLKAAFGEG